MRLGGFEVESYQAESTIISIQNTIISSKGKTCMPYQTKNSKLKIFFKARPISLIRCYIKYCFT